MPIHLGIVSSSVAQKAFSGAPLLTRVESFGRMGLLDYECLLEILPGMTIVYLFHRPLLGQSHVESAEPLEHWRSVS